jgi:hypothetical protein
LPAALAGIGWHAVLDVTPHRDPDSDVSYIVDGLLGAAVLSVLAGSRRLRKIDNRRAALWGAIGAGLPDIELSLKLFKNMKDEDYYFPTHNGKLPHPQTHGLVSTVSQGALVVFSLLAALARYRRMTRLRPAVGADERGELS